MRNYTEPKLEVVTLKTDIITASGGMFSDLFRKIGIEDGGRASLSQFQSNGLE
ncbi:MAG: hypothetical protein II996_03380 [Oscillospiraceae bacterium]|nr:hypothetical protein [Oscillospiraceae bacterium]